MTKGNRRNNGRNLSASDFYALHRPSLCPLRVQLRARGVPEQEISPYERVLRRLGQRHERSHLATLSEVVHLGGRPPEERERLTKEAVAAGATAVYQPRLRSERRLGGLTWTIVGEPDFLVREGRRYVVRDSKMARRINEKDHPEILRVMELYGWLFEQVFSCPPVDLLVHAGSGELVSIPYDRGVKALRLLEEIASYKTAYVDIFSPVGWSKCSGCDYHDHCWSKAEARGDVALIPRADQGVSLVLRDQGVTTIPELLRSHDEASLSDLRPHGARMRRIGKAAEPILRSARAIAGGQHEWLAAPAIPEHDAYVMFDLEGLPPHLDELDKVFLWGLQVFGRCPGPFHAALAGFGEDGDRAGWEDFLRQAGAVLHEHGDAPWVHWASYEKTKLTAYIHRYGDPDGIAARIRANLLDLLPVTQHAVALPLPSYSLKVVEEYVGFRRSQTEYGGDWAMAKYIEAVETDDEEARRAMMDDILRYNQEDLQATWAVMEWLRSRACPP